MVLCLIRDGISDTSDTSVELESLSGADSGQSSAFFPLYVPTLSPEFRLTTG